MDIVISRVAAGGDAVDGYIALRAVLWPMPDDENRSEARDVLSDEGWVVFAACDAAEVIAFVELSIRKHADGASTSPVGFIEGWYVEPAYRKRGIGRRLIVAGEEWASSRGCSELASDAVLDNLDGIEAHRRLGFDEVERRVSFVKSLAWDGTRGIGGVS
jgi:aminoglycoside 6'-N-acetyltransferase I